MDLSHDPIDKILEALQERAKELNCLYQVDELIAKADTTPDDVFRGLLHVIPSGWQHTAVCQARIALEDTVFELPEFRETPWLQTAQIAVQGRMVGKLEVYYGEAMPRSDEGPFLKEERKLIDTIADRIDWDWLERQPPESDTGLVRHLRLAEPLSIRVDGRTGRGVIRTRG